MSTFLIVDDHEVMRTGMKMLIQSNISHSIIDEAFDGESAWHKIRNHDYDLIVMDINMPNTDSNGLMANIFSLKPKSKVLMFSMNCELVYARRYIKMGALGYVGKNESPAILIKAIQTTLSNKSYMSEALKESLMEELDAADHSNSPFTALSSREFEIAQHLAKGKAVSEIAHILNLHSSTIGTHKARILEKLNCANILELNELARTYNFIAS